MLSVVGNDSDGAVDTASGVAAVLTAASMLPGDVAVGVLLPSAEELGLAGARAWVRARGALRGTALNCDGVDDDGELTIMYTGPRPIPLVNALADGAERSPRVRRMPLGLLTDSVAFADAGWKTVTVSRGSLATLRRVHTRRDSLHSLRGDGIDEVSSVLARAAEALAR
jgi:Zn-dependent M28 family amino/carboxypeptidase